MARYNILFQNRTDLAARNLPLPAAVYTLSPNSFVPFQMTDTYVGEVIPAWACMRIAGAPTIYEGDLCWPVCLPDDRSETYQEAGIHIFNSNVPIPVKRYGMGTQDLPAKVLFDYTAPAGGTYGTLYADKFAESDADLWVGGQMVLRSGSWALQSVGNMQSDFQTGGVLPFTYWPYTLMGLDPLPLTNPPPLDPKTGEIAYEYPRYLIWVQRGSGVQIVNDSQLALQIANLNNTILQTVAGL